MENIQHGYRRSEIRAVSNFNRLQGDTVTGEWPCGLPSEGVVAPRLEVLPTLVGVRDMSSASLWNTSAQSKGGSGSVLECTGQATLGYTLWGEMLI